MNLGQRRPDGLVPGLLQVPYLYLVYSINGQYQVKTGTYLVGTPEIWLGTILNAVGGKGDFFNVLLCRHFLKGRAYRFAASALLVCA
jgi:hypothetical protein